MQCSLLFCHVGRDNITQSNFEFRFEVQEPSASRQLHLHRHSRTGTRSSGYLLFPLHQPLSDGHFVSCCRIPSSEFLFEFNEILYGSWISKLHVKTAYEFWRWGQNKFWLFDNFTGNDAMNRELVREQRCRPPWNLYFFHNEVHWTGFPSVSLSAPVCTSLAPEQLQHYRFRFVFKKYLVRI
jgi:hypothetical protein